MKWMMIAATVMVVGCRGKLTAEQHRAVAQGIDEHKIRRILPSELMSSAFFYGKTIADQFQEVTAERQQRYADSLRQKDGVSISVLSSMVGLDSIRGAILEAYRTSETGETFHSDNVQRIANDSILYSTPLPRGSAKNDTALHILVVTIPTHSIIRHMPSH